jgi:hypothetical protein
MRPALASLLAALALLAACASPPDLATTAEASPPVLAAFRGDPPVTSADDWTSRRVPLLRTAFLDGIYGHPPALGAPVVEAREALTLEDVGDAIVEQWTVRLGDPALNRRFHMIVASPKGATQAPLIVMELFCGIRSAIPGRPEAVFEDKAVLPGPCRSQTLDPVIKVVLGKRISGPSIAEVTGAGYALAMFYAGEIVPDDPDLAPPALAALQPGVPADRRAGALAVWAGLYSTAFDALTTDPRFDPARVAAWGHSRYGKTALLAAALDPRFAAVISHQSGRGGASLSRSSAGETIQQITESYGYWFSPAYARSAGRYDADIDQHQLIALIAPRPVMLGSGLADTWSDPAGAFRAAQGATPAYRLFGSTGLTATQLKNDFRPADDLAWWTRGGGHGITTDDWDAFLKFLDAHLKS